MTINIDNNNLNAPVAIVAYNYTVTSTTALNARTGPSTSYPVAKTYAPGATMRTVCQAPGSTVGSTNVWDKLSDGTYVTDCYVSTPSNTGYSAPLPRCGYPYQVAVCGVLYERSGPGRSYPIVGQIPNGGLAWIVCQKRDLRSVPHRCGTNFRTLTGYPTTTSLRRATPPTASPRRVVDGL